jgi:hypothetical protein
MGFNRTVEDSLCVFRAEPAQGRESSFLGSVIRNKKVLNLLTEPTTK